LTAEKKAAKKDKKKAARKDPSRVVWMAFELVETTAVYSAEWMAVTMAEYSVDKRVV